MSDIVLLHGIGQEQRNADCLEAKWLPSLAGSLRLAGFRGLADELWRHNRPGSVEARMAFYGDLFLEPGRQGTYDPHEPQLLTIEETLAEEWLARSADRASRPEDRRIARTELCMLTRQLNQQQGPRQWARKGVDGASRVPWFARAGMAAAQVVHRALAQVSRYLTDNQLRSSVQARVREHLDDQTRVVIGHSLGAVVAFEASHRLARQLPLLVTLGSPLGLRTIVYDRVVPQPPVYPARVQHWVNIADRDDVIAAEPDLRLLFGSSLPANCILDGFWTVDNGADPHNATFYLGKEVLGRLVGNALHARPW